MRKPTPHSSFTITSMATRNGKLAHLPNGLREQLNLRLLEGETARELAAWLNALPEVQSILAAQFQASPISEVNLTHWRQGGYLQWLTERECFDSARALADGDGNLAQTGLSAERLLNVLTLRYGELLMRWDFSPEESASETDTFSVVARKARIFQGMARSLLAIHRIQSRSANEKSGFAAASPNSPSGFEMRASPSSPAAPSLAASRPRAKEPRSASELGGGSMAPRESRGHPRSESPSKGTAMAPIPVTAACLAKVREAVRQSVLPKILSGSIASFSVPLKLSDLPFRADLDLSEILEAV